MYDPAADPRHEADLTSDSVEPAVTSHEGLGENHAMPAMSNTKTLQPPIDVNDPRSNPRADKYLQR